MTGKVSQSDIDTRPETEDGERKAVPQELADRERIREEAVRLMSDTDRSRPLERSQLENLAQGLLSKLALSSAYQGFAMIAISNAFWFDAFAAVPAEQRVLLLPACLRKVALCKGHLDDLGLECARCGACVLDEMQREAEALGCTVVIAEGTPIVIQLLLSGKASAVLGVACLDSLEKAFKSVSSLGIPHMAVPLLTDGCVETTAETETITELLHIAQSTTSQRTCSYLPLLRVAKALFDSGPLEDLLFGYMQTASTGRDEASPVGVVEGLALEWLRAGGKRFRPFITLASHAALRYGDEATSPDVDMTESFSRGIKRIALAIEVLHKASLIHDDLEDDDTYRYGRETLHRLHGIAAAVNVGDYLIGLGYRLVIAAGDELGTECVADILGHLTESHLKLSRGQGGEIARTGLDAPKSSLKEIQRIYALKTAPAFETALYAGIRTTVGHAEELPMDPSVLQRYCRFVGVAYQLINDLKDWAPDEDNKLLPGQDFLAARPTMIGALLSNAVDEEGERKLREIRSSGNLTREGLLYVRGLCEREGVFDKVRSLVDEYRKRALEQADLIGSDALADLLRFLVKTIL